MSQPNDVSDSEKQCEIGRRLIYLGKILLESKQDAEGIRAASAEANSLGHELTRLVPLVPLNI